MDIRIQSLSVENLRGFRGQHQIDFRQNDKRSIEVISGSGSSGKTTLANSISLCLTGELESRTSLCNCQIVNKHLSSDKASGRVSMTVSDNGLNRRYRFSRKFQTSKTRRGPTNLIGPLNIQKEKDGKWMDTEAADAVNAVFPLSSFTFCNLNSETSLGIEEARGGVSWNDLVQDLGDAAARQSSARDIDLEEYFASDDKLGDEMICRMNDLLASIDSRYIVEERSNNLVGQFAETESDVITQSFSAGYKSLISQTAAVVAGELMPASPPLIGDTMFCMFDVETRKKLFQVIKQSNRQVLLFVMEPELEGLNISPQFNLEHNKEDYTNTITSDN